MSVKKKCTCCNSCGNGSGCSSAKVLCTGYRFVLPHLDSVSVSADGEIDEDTIDGTKVFHTNSGGLISGNDTDEPHSPHLRREYTINFSAVDHTAFKSANNDATIYGYKVVANIGGQTMSFDGTAGTGVTVSSDSAVQSTGNGTWAVGPEVSVVGTATSTSTIDSYSFSADSSSRFVSIEAVYFSVRRYFEPSLGGFAYEVRYLIHRTDIYSYAWNRVWVATLETTNTSPSYTITQSVERSRAALIFPAAELRAQGAALGYLETATTPCSGTAASITVNNTLDRMNAGVFGEAEYLVPRTDIGWQLPDISSALIADYTLATTTPLSGSATMSIDTGDWTEDEVGCRDCPRYLTFTGTMDFDVAGDNVTRTISGRMVMREVLECSEGYKCEWSTRPSVATASVTYSTGATRSATCSLVRLGPSLWRLQVSTTYGGGFTPATNYYYLKFGGQCPIGGATVCQQIRQTDVQVDGESSVTATHSYGQNAVSDGMGGVTIEDYDQWGVDGLDHTATTADLGTPELDLSDGYTSRITNHSFSFSETTRVTGDPNYACNGYQMFNTGEEIDADDADLHWQFKPDGGSYGPAYKVSNAFVGSIEYVNPTDSSSAWVGPDASGTSYAPDVGFYKTIVNSDNTPEADLVLRIAADNQCLSLTINGTVRYTNLTPNDVTSHREFHEITIAAAYLQKGANTLEFEVKDDGDAAGFLCEQVE